MVGFLEGMGERVGFEVTFDGFGHDFFIFVGCVDDEVWEVSDEGKNKCVSLVGGGERRNVFFFVCKGTKSG